MKLLLQLQPPLQQQLPLQQQQPQLQKVFELNNIFKGIPLIRIFCLFISQKKSYHHQPPTLTLFFPIIIIYFQFYYIIAAAALNTGALGLFIWQYSADGGDFRWVFFQNIIVQRHPLDWREVTQGNFKTCLNPTSESRLPWQIVSL